MILAQILLAFAQAANVGPGVGEEQTVTYPVSGSGATAVSFNYLPAGYTRAQRYPVVFALHAFGGDGAGLLRNPTPGAQQPPTELLADLYGYVVVAPNGMYTGSAPFYVPGLKLGEGYNSFWADGRNPYDPLAWNYGEQALRDLYDWVLTHYSVDEDRVYLTGASMGGGGAWTFGLHYPDRFAAIAPYFGYSDVADQYALLRQHRPEADDAATSSDPHPGCYVYPYNDLGMMSMIRALAGGQGPPGAGGEPGSSGTVDALMREYGARHLVENAMNLPVRVVHGDQDSLIPNHAGSALFAEWLAYCGGMQTTYTHWFSWPYEHSREPVRLLQDLAAAHPGHYEVQWAFDPDRGHDPVLFALEFSNMIAFFNAKRRVRRPAEVTYVTYDDTHTGAYWLRVVPEAVNSGNAGIAWARSEPERNACAVSVSRTAQVRLDLAQMGMDTGRPLSITVRGLKGWTGRTMVRLSGDWRSFSDRAYRVYRGVTPLEQGAGYEVSADEVTLLDADAGEAANVFVIAPNDLRAVRVFPNPVRRGVRAGAIRFLGLTPAPCRIELFSVSGELVRRIESGGETAEWDLSSASGRAVAAGVYTWLVRGTPYGGASGTIAVMP